MRRAAPAGRRRSGDGRPRVLLVSASMGAGHDGAAREIAAQLTGMGFATRTADFLRSGPLKIGSALRIGYELQLRYAPGSYEATYTFWHRHPRMCGPLARFVTWLTRRRLLAWVSGYEPDVVVSTYPLATLALGSLRASGRLTVPLVNFITDFGVHPLWVHPGADLNLTVHESAATAATLRSGRPAVACGPAVSASFDATTLADRVRLRADLGISAADVAVLVVSGAWAVGDVEETVAAIAGAGGFVPVVACGNDERLRRRLEVSAASGGPRALAVGWTDDMPGLMAACDALVENAGGLTAFEAMRAGLPVVSFAPIPGHGRENTSAMHEAGVSTLASDTASLEQALRDLTGDSDLRTNQVSRARSLFRQPPAELVCRMAGVPTGAAPGADGLTGRVPA